MSNHSQRRQPAAATPRPSASAMDPDAVRAAGFEPTNAPVRVNLSAAHEARLDRKAQQEAGARIVRASLRRVRYLSAVGAHAYQVEGSKPGHPHWVNLEANHDQPCDCEDHAKYGWPCLHMIAARMKRGDDARTIARDVYTVVRRVLADREQLKIRQGRA